MHHILGKIDDLDAAIGNSAEISPTTAKKARDLLAGLRTFMARDLAEPAPGSTTTVGGATITHRPDLVHDERARQAEAQGDHGRYLPVAEREKERLAKTTDAGGMVQAPAPAHPAEEATIGAAVR